MIGLEYFLPAAIFCTLLVVFILGLEWKRTIKHYRTILGILTTSIISIFILSIIFWMWLLTPIEIKTVDVNTSNITIVDIEKSQRITIYDGQNQIFETTKIDTISVGVPEDSVKYEYTFGITFFGDTLFRSIIRKE